MTKNVFGKAVDSDQCKYDRKILHSIPVLPVHLPTVNSIWSTTSKRGTKKFQKILLGNKTRTNDSKQNAPSEFISHKNRLIESFQEFHAKPNRLKALDLISFILDILDIAYKNVTSLNATARNSLVLKLFFCYFIFWYTSQSPAYTAWVDSYFCKLLIGYEMRILSGASRWET